MRKSIEEVIGDLERISLRNGRRYDRVQALFDAEGEHSIATLELHGYMALSDAFKCFVMETVERVNSECRPHVRAQVSEFYSFLVVSIATSFQTLCGAERIALNGYPLQGYTLLRNVFDSLVLTSAAIQRITDFYSIEGIEPGKPVDPVAVRKLRKKTEFAVRGVMTGTESDLSPATQQELQRLDALFDYETHGGRLSFATAHEYFLGRAPLPLLPRFNRMSFALFVNRFCEIAWMLHRLLPLMQPPNALCAPEWHDKWRILDETFILYVESLSDQLGKAVGDAVSKFVRRKFPFTSETPFTL